MSSRHVFVQSVLLPRLLAAIGAGSLLAVPGCGGKTKSSSGEVANPIDGEETSGEQTGGAGSTGVSTKTTNAIILTTSGQQVSTAPPANVTRESTTGELTESPIEATTGSETVNYIETASVPTVSFDAGGPEVTHTSELDAAATSDSAVTSTASTETSVQMCEFGNPGTFCLRVEDMEYQARWGIVQILPEEPLRDDEEIASGWDENHCMKHEWVASGCCNPALGPGQLQKDGSCCYVACEGACCGRPFIVNGAAVVAAVVPSADWLVEATQQTVATDVATMDAATCTKLAQAWLEDATMEHASVASFSQFTLDLLALGAPPELVRDSQRAGLDEIEHARFGFSLASRLAGMEYGPGNLSIGTFTPHSLSEAIAAAIAEGCVGETLAAGVVAEQARLCTDPALAAELAQIADDELRHSELAWRFIAWAVQRFGVPAHAAAQAAFERAIATSLQAPAELGLAVEALHAVGRITPREWQNTVEQVMREVIEPAAAALIDGISNPMRPGTYRLKAPAASVSTTYARA